MAKTQTRRTENDNKETTQTMKTRWTRSAFEYTSNSLCLVPDQPKELSGYIESSGVFAIERETWKVTHLPSGCSFGVYHSSFKSAKVFCQSILEAVDVSVLKSVGQDALTWRGKVTKDGRPLVGFVKELLMADKTVA